MVSAPPFYFDMTERLPPVLLYRAWQTGANVAPLLKLGFVPALRLSGPLGTSLRVDAINQCGPTDAWVTLATQTLTNAAQYYFDTSAVGQPPRLYRLVPGL